MSSPEQKREYIRVAAHLTLNYEILKPDALPAARNEIMNQTPSRAELEIEVDRFWRSDDVAEKIDEQLAQLHNRMDEINDKLDYLIAVGEGRVAEVQMTRRSEILDISAIGLSFLETVSIPESSYLRMRIELSRFPVRHIVCIGQVVRSVSAQSEDGSCFEIGIRFEQIHDDDREKIFRFVSRVERKMLRERKEMMAS